MLPRDEVGRRLRERVLRVAGNPASYGAPEPLGDFFAAGISLCQDYLAQVADGSITCRPAVIAIDGTTVEFTDGSTETVDAIICATGYEIDLPYLDPAVRALLGPELTLYQRTLHPDLEGFGVIGQFLAQGPYFPLLELQARWIVALWAGDVAPPDTQVMRRAIALPPPRWMPTTCSRSRSPKSWASRPTCWRARSSPKRCCSDRCCRRATASTGRERAPMPASISPSSSPPRHARPSIPPTSRRCATLDSMWRLTSSRGWRRGERQPGYSSSPARIGCSSRFSGGASGQAQLGS